MDKLHRKRTISSWISRNSPTGVNIFQPECTIDVRVQPCYWLKSNGVFNGNGRTLGTLNDHLDTAGTMVMDNH